VSDQILSFTPKLLSFVNDVTTPSSTSASFKDNDGLQALVTKSNSSTTDTIKFEQQAEKPSDNYNQSFGGLRGAFK